MISWLQDWVRTILLFVLFAGFLELMLPSSNMKRFVQVVVGLFILATILGPVVLLMNNLSREPRIEVPAFTQMRTQEVIQNGQELARRQREQVVEQYRQNIARQVSSLLELSGENTVLRVQVEIDTTQDKPTFGQLQSLDVTLKGSKDAGSGTAENIARILADFYGLSPDQVRVQTVSQGG